MEEKNRMREELKDWPLLSVEKSGSTGYEVGEEKLLQLGRRALKSQQQKKQTALKAYRLSAAAVVIVLLTASFWFFSNLANSSLEMAENGNPEIYFNYLSEESMLLEDKYLIEMIGELYLQSMEDQSNEDFY